MSTATKIEWTQSDDGTAGATWNPVTGCDEVSEGCARCYAKTFAERWRGVPGHHFERGFDVTMRPERLDQPLHWKRPKRIFVNSMSDLFHKDVPDEFIACVFTVMAKARQHTFQLLTKRHARMRSLLNSAEFQVMCFAAALSRGWDLEGTPWPLPNVHLGVSVENQHWADIRIPALLGTPASVRFLSCEPLLGPVNLIGQGGELVGAGVYSLPDPPQYDGGDPVCQDHGIERCTRCRFVNWVIAGGESGQGARRCELDWLRFLRDQCDASQTPFFLKQLGSVAGRELGAGPKGGDWDKWPDDLKVREFPLPAEAVTAR